MENEWIDSRVPVIEREIKKKKTVTIIALQSKRELLETRLNEKTKELKKLCIQEAELTGILPPETPIDPGESPPIFRRRIRTAFTFPQSLINKLKSKDEELLAELEVQCRVQTSISEAALALANDLRASKSIRRNHRLEYQQSQRRLCELEMRLNVLKQSMKNGNQFKQRKKPRPPPFLGQKNLIEGKETKTCTLPYTKRSSNHNLCISNNINKSTPHIPVSTQIGNHHWNHPSSNRSCPSSDCSDLGDSKGNLSESDTNKKSQHRQNSLFFSNDCYSTMPNDRKRIPVKCGSLDRRQHRNHPLPSSCNRLNPRVPTLLQSSGYLLPDLCCEPSISASTSTKSINLSSDTGSVSSSILLPNQTYPNSICSFTRTRSFEHVEQTDTHCPNFDFHSLRENTQLGIRQTEKERNVINEQRVPPNSDSNKNEEKTSTTPPLRPRASKIDKIVPQRPVSLRVSNQALPPSPVSSQPYHDDIPSLLPPIPIKSPELLETVPYESPQNQTVVEVGKWVPYREVVKPFEMSDFYKYSTKFKKPNQQLRSTTSQIDQNENVQNIHGEHSSEFKSVETDISNKIDNTTEPPYLTVNFMKNITQRKYRPLSVVNSKNISRDCQQYT